MSQMRCGLESLLLPSGRLVATVYAALTPPTLLWYKEDQRHHAFILNSTNGLGSERGGRGQQLSMQDFGFHHIDVLSPEGQNPCPTSG